MNTADIPAVKKMIAGTARSMGVENTKLMMPSGFTHRGREVSFSDEAFIAAMSEFSLQDIADVVGTLESKKPSKKVSQDIAEFMRDFAIIQEVDHPDFDRGYGIGNLATRIELALGQVTEAELQAKGYDLVAASYDYELAFGTK